MALPRTSHKGRAVYQITMTYAGLWFMTGLWLACLPLVSSMTASSCWGWLGWAAVSWVWFFYVLLRCRTPNMINRLLFYIGCFCTGAALAAATLQWSVLPQQAAINALPTYIEAHGVITAPLSQGAFNKPRRVLRFKYNDNSYTVQATFKKQTPETTLEVGHPVSFKGSLHRPEPARFKGGFDEQSYYLTQGWDASLTVDHVTTSTVKIVHGLPLAWLKVNALTNKLRQTLLTQYEKALPRHEAQLMASVVLGAHAAPIDRDLKQTFVRSGLIHLLAASGLNVGLIAVFFLGLGRLLRLPLNASLGVTMAGVALYCLMTGLPPSVQRAGAMLELALFFKLLRHEFKSLSLLIMAGCLLAATNPVMTQSVSFQLSFLSTLGLITMTQPLQRRLGFYLTHRLAGLIVVPLVAQLWVLPLIWLIFGQIQLASLLANIAALPLATLVTWTGFVGGAISLVLPALGQFIIHWMGWAVAGLQGIAGAVSAQSWAVWSGPPPPTMWVITAYWALIFTGCWFTYGCPLSQRTTRAVQIGLLLLLCVPIPLRALAQPKPFLSLLPHRYGSTSFILHQPSPVILTQKLTPGIVSDLLRYARQNNLRHIALLTVNHPTKSTNDALKQFSASLSIGQIHLTDVTKHPVASTALSIADKPKQSPKLTLRHWHSPRSTLNRIELIGAAKPLCISILDAVVQHPEKAVPNPKAFSPLTKDCAVQWNVDSQALVIETQEWPTTEGLTLYKRNSQWQVGAI